MTLQPFDLVLFEQELDATSQALHGIEPLSMHRRKIQLGRNLDSHLGHRAASRRLKIFRRMKQRLGRDAADVEASPAERLTTFGARSLETELRSADRSNVAAGAGADHQDVEIVAVRSHSKTPLALSLSKGCFACSPSRR